MAGGLGHPKIFFVVLKMTSPLFVLCTPSQRGLGNIAVCKSDFEVQKILIIYCWFLNP
jgi:hypothetical protein